jgi:hypothetical protein
MDNVNCIYPGKESKRHFGYLESIFNTWNSKKKRKEKKKEDKCLKDNGPNLVLCLTQYCVQQFTV